MNEVPHPGFDKPEEYETFLTTNGLEDAANKFANQDCVTFISRKKGFIAGAEWQKEQILNWAKDKWAEGYLVAMDDLIKDIKNKLI